MNQLRLIPPAGAAPVSLEEGARVVIGRAEDCTVILTDKRVSTRHAVVEVGEDGPVIRDLGSANGTWVNGQQLQKTRQLGEGDMIAVGSKVLRVTSVPPETKVAFHEEEIDEGQIYVTFDALDRSLDEANKTIAVLQGMSELLLDIEDEDDLCARLLGLVFDELSADRACVILLDAEGNLVNRTARARTKEQEGMAVSSTIVRKVVEEGISLITSDAATDERFRRGQSIIVQGIRAAMCAPIRGRREVVGALYADTQVETGVFKREDLELITSLGIQGGIAIDNLRLARENLEAERLAAIGGVVAGLSHDIRNVVGALKSGSYVLDKNLSGSRKKDIREAWEIFKQGTDTIAELVEDMVSYSKKRQPDLVPLDLNNLVERVATRFGPRAAEQGVSLTASLSPEVGEVPMDESSIDRVLSNLISNALDAIGEKGGSIVLTTNIRGEEAELVVADDGCGIPPENLRRMFDLLFSTKGSKGTGFGLAVAGKIAEEHGGRVEVEYEPGEGATFRLILTRG